MKGEGAIVFLIVFIVLLAATLAASSLPPGRDLYGLLGVPETNYPVLRVPTTRAPCVGNISYYCLESISPITEEEQCNKCGKCAEVCPTAAITIDTLVKTEQDACICCCACVKNCPINARIMKHPRIKKVAKRLSTNYSERKEPEIYI